MSWRPPSRRRRSEVAGLRANRPPPLRGAIMRRVAVLLTILGVAIVFGFFGWALFATRTFGSWTGGSRAIAIMMVAGTIGTGGLTAVLLWLAFYSDRNGFDEPPRFGPPSSDS